MISLIYDQRSIPKQIPDSYSYPQLATDTSSLRISTAQTPVSHEISRMSLRPQAQLTVSQPGDFYEQEADRVAQQVMGMGDSSLQRQTTNQEEDKLRLKPVSELITPLAQQEEIPEEEEELIQAKSSLQPTNDGGLEADCDRGTSIIGYCWQKCYKCINKRITTKNCNDRLKVSAYVILIFTNM